MKKTYIAPEAQMIDLKPTTILAGSNTFDDDGGIDINYGTLPTGNGSAARSRGQFDLWEDIDETNGYKE